MPALKSFYKKVALILIISYLAIAVVFTSIFPDKFHWTLLVVPGFIGLITSILHKKLLSVGAARPQKFINMFMAVTGSKLMIYLFFILIYIWFLTAYAIPFLAIFFSLYIAFTFLEIHCLLKFLNSMKTNS